MWHVRRECLWALASNDANILADELRYSAEVARENPKNYQIWYHRRALVEKIGVKAAADELALISTALRDDAKNYHAWSNRLWVLKTYAICGPASSNFARLCSTRTSTTTRPGTTCIKSRRSWAATQ